MVSKPAVHGARSRVQGSTDGSVKKCSGILFLLIVALTAASLTFAQTPSFDVSSIKANKSGGRTSAVNLLKRRSATNATVKNLILLAYHLQGFQLAEAPGWLDSDRFDVAASIDGDTSTGRSVHHRARPIARSGLNPCEPNVEP